MGRDDDRYNFCWSSLYQHGAEGEALRPQIPRMDRASGGSEAYVVARLMIQRQYSLRLIHCSESSMRSDQGLERRETNGGGPFGERIVDSAVDVSACWGSLSSIGPSINSLPVELLLGRLEGVLLI